MNDDSLGSEDKEERIYNSIVEEKNKIDKIELLDQDIDINKPYIQLYFKYR